jgi:hypothetical protein
MGKKEFPLRDIVKVLDDKVLDDKVLDAKEAMFGNGRVRRNGYGRTSPHP